MDFSLLRNKVYLYLLAFCDGKKMPSYVELGSCLGITRQTASTKVKELINNELVFIEDGIIFVKNPLNIEKKDLINYLENNKDFDPIELKTVLFGNALAPQSRMEIGRELKMAKETIYSKIEGVVYGICVDGRLKYIGTTQHFEKRISQHCAKRPFLSKDNFIILSDQVDFQLENYLIHLLQPEWNSI